jgi:hypothetical protein
VTGKKKLVQILFWKSQSNEACVPACVWEVQLKLSLYEAL